MNQHLNKYPTPKTLNYWNAFGFILGMLFILQLISGFILACFYVAEIKHAAASINYIKHEILFGGFIQKYHMVGANLLFIVAIFHIIRSIYYQNFLTYEHD